jgi:hypothetical protein
LATRYLIKRLAIYYSVMVSRPRRALGKIRER